MWAFRDIVGQPGAVKQLAGAVASGRSHHAYLFDGPDGVGKAHTARALARALNCLTPEAGRCDCVACRKIDAGTHPDVSHVDMTPKGLTERMRDLVGSLAFRPHEGRTRVLVLDPAEELAGRLEGRAEAANALLKTLEEPPADTVFVLVTAEARRLPVTIRSRCQRVRFQPLPSPLIVTQLTTVHGAPAELAAVVAEQSGGSLGRAVAALEDREAIERRREQLQRLVALRRRGQPPDVPPELSSDREEAGLVLELLLAALRGALVDAVQAGRTTATILPATIAARDTLRDVRAFVAPALALEQLQLRLAKLGPLGLFAEAA